MSGPASRQTGKLVLPLVVAAIALAGRGGSVKSPAVASVGTTAPETTAGTTTTSGASGGSAPSQGQLQQSALKYSQCMRSHGVPNFPDPSPGGGFIFQAGAGLNPDSPAVRRAQAKCKKYMGSSPPGPGTVTHPSAQWLAQMVKAAACMRRHGYPDFPDPRTSVPSNPFGSSGAGVISNIDGAIFIFPGPSTRRRRSSTGRRTNASSRITTTDEAARTPPEAAG
jgi:hypothetical protein